MTRDGHTTHHEYMSTSTDLHVVPEWTLGWRLQRALAHAGIAVEDMARALGVSRSTVSRWMHDQGARPRVVYLKRWADWCGVSPSWLSDGLQQELDDLFGQPPMPRKRTGAKFVHWLSTLRDIPVITGMSFN